MTKEDAEKFLPIIQAYIEGKTIQQKRQVGYEDEWVDVNHLLWNENPSNYRIKPESTYRPFKNQEECWNEMHKHPDFGYIIYDNSYRVILTVDSGEITFLYDMEPCSPDFEQCLRQAKFTDGIPFGIKED